MVVGVRRSFQFLRQKTWFLENNRALSKVSIWGFALLNSYYQVIIKSVHKKQLYINHGSV